MNDTRAVKRKRIGELLVDEKVISPPQLALALEKMKITRKRLGEQLVDMRICTERDIVNALSKQLKIPIVELSKVPFDREALSLVKKSLATDCNCFPFQIEGQFIHIAFADPLRIDKIQYLEAMTQRAIKKYISAQSDIDNAIEKNYATDDGATMIMNNLAPVDDVSTNPLEDKESLDAMVSSFEKIETNEDGLSAVELRTMAEDKGVVTTVNHILRIAVGTGASDIHFEPQRKQTTVRTRIDGILGPLTAYPRSIHLAVVSRIKVICGLDIAEKRIPQDGKVRATMGHKHEVDLRVSTIPTKYGEKVVVRILDQSKEGLTLDKIFFEEKQHKIIETVIRASQGMILVTGPTGSGKTSTLYSIIRRLHKPQLNIVTIEDPIEYELEGINQVQVNSHIGLTFAKILRSILRQDPNIILVGEIRDHETAEVAVQAAQTGHLVLSTLHTNNTYATITRLADIGVPPQHIASCMQAITAQRLVRRVCKECKQEYTPDPELLARYCILPSQKFYSGKGCEVCNNTGYKGRLCITEIMVANPELRAVIAEGKPEHEVKNTAIKNGMELLFDVGRRYVTQGLTTVEELDRVIESTEAEDKAYEESVELANNPLNQPQPIDSLHWGEDGNASHPPLAQMPIRDSSTSRFDALNAPDPNVEHQPPMPMMHEQSVSTSCPNCSEPVKSHWKACPNCGSKLEPPRLNCPSCSEPIKPHWKACPNCGEKLSAQDTPKSVRTSAVSSHTDHQAPDGGRPSDMLSIDGQPRVLVVDDQKSMQKLVSIALKGIGCEVLAADDGVQALEVVKRFRPHLIILDIVMPKMDGLEVCRRLRTDVRTAFIPIMMLTSLSDDKSRLKGYVAGTDDYLAKPFVLEEFYSRVRNLLRRTYGYFSAEDETQTAGSEWDASTEEAKANQKMLDQQSLLDKLDESQAQEQQKE